MAVVGEKADQILLGFEDYRQRVGAMISAYGKVTPINGWFAGDFTSEATPFVVIQGPIHKECSCKDYLEHKAATPDYQCTHILAVIHATPETT